MHDPIVPIPAPTRSRSRLGVIAVAGLTAAFAAFGIAVAPTDRATPVPETARNVADPSGLGAALAVTFPVRHDVDHPLEFVLSERFPSHLFLTADELGYPEAEFADDVGGWILGN